MSQVVRRLSINSQNIEKSDAVSRPNHRYITGLDGLRALAVIGVITFHLLPNWVSGGWLGVPLFFIISGYLITTLLIQEYEHSGNIGFLPFWGRRLRRLYPPLVVMLLLTVFLILLLAPQQLYNLRYIVFSNLLYVYNFWAMGHGGSYFDQINGASPFTHLWSLSIEAQFYLLWPGIVWLLLKSRLKKIVISTILVLGASLSALLMGLFYSSASLNRVYYGTDTRIFAILLGAALAFVWPAHRLTTRLDREMRFYINVIGLVAAVDTVLAFLVINGQAPFVYKGGMFALTLIMTIFLAIVVHPVSLLNHLLDRSWLNYIGKRSYSIYLYQLPVFVFYPKLVKNFHFSIWQALIEVALVLAISEVSYRYVETLFRHPKQRKRAWQWLKQRKLLLYPTAMVTALFLITIAGGLIRPEAGMAAPKTDLQKRLEKAQKDLAQQKSHTDQKKHDEVADTALTPEQTKLIQDYQITTAQYRYFSQLAITVVGDSVMLDVAPNLQELNDHLSIDAQVGRQADDAIPALINQIKTGHCADTILIGLGTNGTIRASDIDALVAAAGKQRQIYWVNNYVVTKPWQDSNNRELDEAKQNNRNFHVIDWYSLVKDHPEWLASDGIHPETTGNHHYARLVIQAISKDNR